MVAVDQLSLGHNSVGSGSTVTLTTPALIATSGWVAVEVTWYGAQTLSSVGGGGLTWTVEQQGASTTDSNAHSAIAWAQAPSGLAASTVLTATFSAGTTDASIAAMSFTGVAATTPVDTKIGPTNTPSTAWSSGAMTLAAGSVAVAAAFITSFGSPTSTPGGGTNEAVDFNFDGNGTTLTYHIDSGSGGSYTATGTWSVSTGGVVNAVAFKTAGGGASSFSQSATDSITLGESLARVLALPRAISETLSITDVAARATQAFTRTAADSITLAEAVTAPVGRPRSATDALGVTDAATRSALNNPRAVTDTVTVADNATSNGGGTPASTLINLPLTGAGT